MLHGALTVWKDKFEVQGAFGMAYRSCLVQSDLLISTGNYLLGIAGQILLQKVALPSLRTWNLWAWRI